MDRHEPVGVGNPQHAGHDPLPGGDQMDRAAVAGHVPLNLQHGTHAAGVDEGDIGQIQDERFPRLAAVMDEGHQLAGTPGEMIGP